MIDLVRTIDCFEAMAGMDDKSVDLVLSDPPYEENMHVAKAGARGKKVSNSPFDIKGRKFRTDGQVELKPIAFASIDGIREKAAAEMVRLSRGWVLVFCTPEGIAPWRDAFEAAGAKYKRACFWVKPDSAPQFNGQGPAFAVEAFVAVWCGTGFSKWNGGGRRNWFICPTNWPGRDGRHPTEKPVPLMAQLVSLFSAPDALVFDPFCGTGAIGVASVKTGRRFLGCEFNPEWAAIANERIAD